MFDSQSDSRTPLANFGEFKLIKHLTQFVKLNQDSTVLGIGDDAAVIKSDQGSQVVLSSDMLVEGVHFNLAYMPLKHLGYKAVMVNLSDIYAMNAEARQIMVSMAVSNRFPVEALEELYAGIKLACELYNIDLIGGDTTSSQTGLVLSITAIGQVRPEDLVKRTTAKAGDLIVVSGDLGGAYMGLQVLERERQVFEVNPEAQPDLEQYTYIVERQLKPEARKDIPKLLKELEVKPTSMIDISDGLSSELMHLSKASGIGAKLFEEKLPLDPTLIQVCEEFEIDSTMVALSGGEDYELLFTIDQSDFEKIKGNPNLTVIGHMTAANEPCYLITRAGQQLELQAQGWNSTDSNTAQ
ncbi:thiamine-phosphate kinase [Flavobacteriaceae bacterium]|nr:thiamine-phosphate kinase [Flavobacteriaceae bacterium]